MSLLGLGLASGSLMSPVLSAPRPAPLSALPVECRTAIRRHGPGPSSAVDGPDLFLDDHGDLSIGWSSRTNAFFASASMESTAARGIGTACPKVAIVVFSGPTGGTERWYIRRDGFSVRHSRDSGLPGDASKYWNWETVPFDYDPGRSYESEPQP
jgi:hypothetical protein